MNEPKLTGSQIYKAVANYLFNTMGITKQYIIDLIDHRLDKIVENHLKQWIGKDKVNTYLRATVNQLLTGKSGNNFYGEPAVDKWIKQQMREIIQQELAQQYKFEVIMTNNKGG